MVRRLMMKKENRQRQIAWLASALAAMAMASARAQTESILYSFNQPPHGSLPLAGVIRDNDGNLYGTTQDGGQAGWGVVYKIDTAGRQKVLYSFTGSADGGRPYAGVVRDASGNLYGTTYY